MSRTDTTLDTTLTATLTDGTAADDMVDTPRRHRLHTAVGAALAVVLLGLTGLFATTTGAQPAGVGNGDVNWNGWTLNYGVPSGNDGLRLSNVEYNGTVLMSRISMPVMSVYYEQNACGPYADQLGGAVFDGVFANEFTLNGEQWLELAIEDTIGSYVIYQSYYFSESGAMDAHVFSKGLQCNIFHEHLPYWRIDFDVDGVTNDQVVRLDQLGGYVVEGAEFDLAANAAANHEWYVRDSITGTSVRLNFDDGTYNQTGTIVPETDYIENNVYGREYSGATNEIIWQTGPRRDLGFNEGQAITDLVLWYTGFMPHSPEEGQDLWHSTGLRMEIVPDPLGGGTPPTPTPAPGTPTAVVPTPTPVPTPTSAVPTATPTTVPPTATPTPDPSIVDIPLTDGITSGPYAGAQGDEVHFAIQVPAGAAELEVVITGAGDADLYTLFGTHPTQSAWQCRPYFDQTSNETCVIPNPQAGEHHFMIRGWRAFSNVQITATVTMPSGPPCVLTSGVAQTGMAGAAGDEYLCRISVPTGTTRLDVALSGSGDADLYTRFGAAPTLTEWDCRPWFDQTSNETCTAINPTPGDHWILVRGYRPFSATSVVATLSSAPLSTALSSGVPVTGLSGAEGDELFFTIDVPAGTTSVTVELSGGTGDADLYTRLGLDPTEIAWDCRPFVDFTNNETCTLTNVPSGRHHIMVRGYRPFAGATLTATLN